MIIITMEQIVQNAIMAVQWKKGIVVFCLEKYQDW